MSGANLEYVGRHLDGQGAGGCGAADFPAQVSEGVLWTKEKAHKKSMSSKPHPNSRGLKFPTSSDTSASALRVRGRGLAEAPVGVTATVRSAGGLEHLRRRGVGANVAVAGGGDPVDQEIAEAGGAAAQGLRQACWASWWGFGTRRTCCHWGPGQRPRERCKGW